MEEHNWVLKLDTTKMFYGINASFESLAEAFLPLVKEVSRVWSDVKELIKSILNRKEENQHDDQQNWLIDWDTRKESQVILNKPKFIVRKIIG